MRTPPRPTAAAPQLPKAALSALPSPDMVYIDNIKYEPQARQRKGQECQALSLDSFGWLLRRGKVGGLWGWRSLPALPGCRGSSGVGLL